MVKHICSRSQRIEISGVKIWMVVMEQEVFISTEELNSLLTRKERLFILDGSILLTGDAKDSFIAKRIPGARFFDQMELRDKTAWHPMAYLPASAFGQAMMALRVPNDGSLVVVYDQEGMRAAPRVWFVLQYYGYQRVRFLNGGLPKWEAEGRPMASGPIEAFTCHADPNQYRFSERSEMVTDFDRVKSLVEGLRAGRSDAILWDPRGPSVAKEMMIPQSINIFYQSLLNDDYTPKSPPAIREILRQGGVDLSKPIVVTCNKGLMACTGALLLAHLGKRDTKLNRGSWQEWSQRAKL